MMSSIFAIGANVLLSTYKEELLKLTYNFRCYLHGTTAVCSVFMGIDADTFKHLHRPFLNCWTTRRWFFVSSRRRAIDVS